jgi:uncharacterized surface anchored protein
VVIDAANKITTTSTTATDHWRSVPFAYFSNTFRRNRPDNAESTEPHYGKDTIVVRNQKQGEVELVKVGKDGELLPGAKFELRDPNGKVIDSWVTDDQPHKITGLDAGKYFIVETQAPAGHQKTDDVVEITVDKDGNVTKRVINKNDIPVDDSKKEKKKSPDDGGDDKEIDSIIKTLKEEVNQGA